MEESNKERAKAERVYRMAFGAVYPLYVQKAVRKGRTKAEVDEVIAWLTGYSIADIERLAGDGSDFEAFFAGAPRMNPNADKITGKICGIRVEEITDPVIRDVRRMDKLIDELAQGRAMGKVKRE